MEIDNKNKLVHDLRSKLFIIMLQIDLLKIAKEDNIKENQEKILSTMTKAVESMKLSLEEWPQ